MQVTHLKSAALKALVVLVPSYTAAYLSDKMVWVVPTLAASSFFAATIGVSGEYTGRSIDEDHQDSEATDHVDQLEGLQTELESS